MVAVQQLTTTLFTVLAALTAVHASWFEAEVAASVMSAHAQYPDLNGTMAMSASLALFQPTKTWTRKGLLTVLLSRPEDPFNWLEAHANLSTAPPTNFSFTRHSGSNNPLLDVDLSAGLPLGSPHGLGAAGALQKVRNHTSACADVTGLLFVFPTYPCVTEPLLEFACSDVEWIYVGAETARVCRTATTTRNPPDNSTFGMNCSLPRFKANCL